MQALQGQSPDRVLSHALFTHSHLRKPGPRTLLRPILHLAPWASRSPAAAVPCSAHLPPSTLCYAPPWLLGALPEHWAVSASTGDRLIAHAGPCGCNLTVPLPLQNSMSRGLCCLAAGIPVFPGFGLEKSPGSSGGRVG